MAGRDERVFLVRHGETEWNGQGRRQGQLDSPLTRRGEQQADAVGQRLRPCSIDAVLSSPLGRAHQTALIIAGHLGHRVETLDALAELHHGELAGLSNEQIEARHPGLLREREQDKYQWRFPKGESYQDAAGRARDALQHLADAGYVRPLLVTHEMIGRLLLAALLDLRPDDALAQNIPHGTIVEIDPCERLAFRHRIP